MVARQEEIQSQKLHKTNGEPILLLLGQKFTNTSYIYKTKIYDTGIVEQFKARLVFQIFWIKEDMGPGIFAGS